MSSKKLKFQKNSMEVREINGMKGLFSTTNFRTGDVVCKIVGEKISEPSRTSVQVGINEHIDVKEPIMYINHRCNGNIGLKNDTFVAIEDIACGDEITFDYNETELVLAEPFNCRDCGQLLKGKRFLDELDCSKKYKD